MQEQLKISRTMLLSFYGIIPLSLFLVALDMFALDGRLRRTLPESPDSLFILSIVFNFPHIIASSLSFFDAEYLKHYRKRLFLPGLAIVAGVFVVPHIIGRFLSEVFVGAWTIKHIIGQQLGINLMLARIGTRFFLWKWTGLAVGTLLYFGAVMPRMGKVDIRPYVENGSLILLVPLLFLTLKMLPRAHDKTSRYYFRLNYAMLAAVWVVYSLDYDFFVILIPRAVHDFTAFSFYITHDHNRNASHAPNILYRPLRKIGLPAGMLCPLLAMLLAWPLTAYAYRHQMAWAVAVGVIVTLFHYYTDSFVWKQGSPHRRFVAVT